MAYSAVTTKAEQVKIRASKAEPHLVEIALNDASALIDEVLASSLLTVHTLRMETK